MPRFLKYKLDHLSFWLLTVFFHGYTRVGWIDKAGISQFLLELIIRNGLLACAIYLTILYSIPQLTSGRKIGLGILGIAVSILLYVGLKNIHDVYFYGYVLRDTERTGFFHNSFYNLSIVFFYLAFASTLHLSKQWFLQREQMRKIEIEKLNTELDYLRAQINPHFLFNSINTIYFQINKENTAARETLDKFSSMLRYQLYECNGNEITIEKEINYLQSYVALQQLRMNENLLLIFRIDETIRNFSVPPLLFIPFVENAFKHVSHFTDRKNEISIRLMRSENTLTLTVTNTKEELIATRNGEGGIGLKNINRRLELLYNKQFELQVENLQECFKVRLTIPIV